VSGADEPFADKPDGAFFAIEGGEGAGKGTILAELAARLRGQNLDVLTTREPGGTPEGQNLREILLGSGGQVWDPWAELLLMTAARVQHVRNVIIPAVQRRQIVISDRFAGSTLAYQGAGRGMPAEEILRLHKLAVGDFWPDLTIVLDIDPRIGIGRSLARLQAQGLDEGRFEKMDLGFHDRVRESFLTQAAARPGSHVVVDAGLPIDHVRETVFEIVLDWLRKTDP